MAIDINIGALCLVRQNGSFFGPRREHRDGRRARPRAGNSRKRPASRGGARLRLVAGNVEVSKADLILEALR
jgi:hypothetical protein